ncbi:hypothetical protein NP118_23370, partial [Salmonella enterica]|nr:hypothetical protein [Salmonella enterica]
MAKKDDGNKKGYKSRITRSRKLGVMAKPNNKDNKDNKDNNEFFSEDSTDIDEENNIICKQIRQGKMYAGDLIIPYKGIDENTHKIDFIIFGINKEQITNEE